ncbi:MAG: SIMPL domain-containing protein [Patescibacteria group bacterium]
MSNWKNILLFFVLLFVFSKWGPAIPFSTTTQSRGEPLIVMGEGKVSVTPDVAKINLGITESGQTLKQVQSAINSKSKTVVDAIKKLGISESDIKTTSYNVFPQYDYTNPGSRITGYQASTNYEVTIKDFDKVNDVLTVVSATGANIVGGVSFDLSESLKNEKMGEARKIAADSAKEKAKSLAGAAGITLGKIINVTEGQGIDYPRPYLMEKSLPITDGDVPIARPDIQPGQTDLSVTVSLSYEIR